MNPRREDKKTNILVTRLIQDWVQQAELRWRTAMHLSEKKDYADCLFYCHLVLECLLKAVVTKRTQTTAPYMHHLVRLIELAGLKSTSDLKRNLLVINTFNVRARYDDYKQSFYKRATRSYATKWMKTTNSIRLWLLKELQNN